jgi:2'-5' RNA ligase
VGVAEQPELIHLAAAIEDGLQKCGIQKERKPFKGHITIGRCKKSFPKCRKIETFSGSFRFSVNEVILYSSVLKPEGTEYRLEKKIRFA